MEYMTKFHKLAKDLVDDFTAEALCDRLRSVNCPVRDYDDAHYRLFLAMNEFHRETTKLDRGNQKKWFRAFPGLLKMMRVFATGTGLYDFPEADGYGHDDELRLQVASLMSQNAALHQENAQLLYQLAQNDDISEEG